MMVRSQIDMFRVAVFTSLSAGGNLWRCRRVLVIASLINWHSAYTNYVVLHFKHTIGNLRENQCPIDFPLTDVSFGVTIDKWPEVIDADLFTKAIRNPFPKGRYEIMLSQVNDYAKAHWLKDRLDPESSNQDFVGRQKPFVAQQRQELEEDLKAKLYMYSTNDYYGSGIRI